MGIADKLAIIGHNGWAASRITRNLAAHPFRRPLHILVRHGSDVSRLPPNGEIARYSWDDQVSLCDALEGVDILILSPVNSFVGPEGLKDQAKLIEPMKQAGVKLFAPSDLALPYTVEERIKVQIPREKWELEQQLYKNGVPFVVICIGNFTSFALDSPYVNVDLPNHRIVHIGNSRQNLVWLCSLDYVAAGITSLLSEHHPAELANRLIGLNELRPTTRDIERAMTIHAGRAPQVAHETVENIAKQAGSGRLDALVRKKMGDGTHSAVRELSEI